MWLQKDKQLPALLTADSEQLMGESYTETSTVECHVKWGQSVEWTVKHVEHSGNLSDPMLTIADTQLREEINETPLSSITDMEVERAQNLAHWADLQQQLKNSLVEQDIRVLKMRLWNKQPHNQGQLGGR